MSAGRLNELYETYSDRVQFYVVYIAEAHAIDSAWPMVGRGHPLITEPVTTEERMERCGKCVVAMEIKQIPALVDRIDNEVNQAYQAWPDRLYLVDEAGRIAYGSGPGPRGFKPDELEAAIRKELGLPPLEKARPDAEEPARTRSGARRGPGY